MSQEIVHIAMNSGDIPYVNKSCVDECSKGLELKTELLKKKDFIEKDVYDKLVKSYSTLEQHFLAKQGLVKGLPKLKYAKDHLCLVCQMGKRKKEPHPHKPEPTTSEKLQMLHMDLCGPMQVASINGKRYILVIVDDYSRLTWVKFLRTKDEALEIIIKILKQAQVSLKATVRYLRTDNNTEFINQTLRNYTENVGITHHTSTTRTPQQNDVVERRNRTLVKATRTMLIFFKSLFFLWAEAMAIACYTQNRSLIHPRCNKTLYELLRDRKLEIKYFHVFGALCYPTNDFEVLDLLFQPMFDEYFKPPSVISTTISAATLPPPDTAGASSSTSIDQDASSLSTLPNNESTSRPINSTNVKEPNNKEEVEFDIDTFTNPYSLLVPLQHFYRSNSLSLFKV
ncbi:retrovirus-related pol polyprotein from transposon TNT 1-94 [Tanacetum coccineum]